MLRSWFLVILWQSDVVKVVRRKIGNKLDGRGSLYLSTLHVSIKVPFLPILFDYTRSTIRVL